jgi:hypothetical protein
MSAIKNPRLLVNQFMNYMDELNIPYNNAKTLATFVWPSQAAVVGLSNVTFFNTSFPDSEHFMIVGIRALTGANATLAATAWTPGISDALTQNGSISIINNGTQELKDFPLTKFVLSTNNNDAEAGSIVLDKEIFWLGQTTLALNANFPTAPTTVNQNLRFELEGIKLI